MEESQTQTQSSNAPPPPLQPLFESLENVELETIHEDEEEETQTHTQAQSTVTGKKRKKTEKRSPAWDYYRPVDVEEGDPPVKKHKGECKVCGRLIAAHSTINGTSALRKYTIICNKRLARNDGQQQLSLQPSGNGSGTLTSWKFDQKDSRLALCEMIILDELPFRFVEKERFKKFVARVCPEFRIPSRQAIREDCARLFLAKRDILKSFFTKKRHGKGFNYHRLLDCN